MKQEKLSDINLKSDEKRVFAVMNNIPLTVADVANRLKIGYSTASQKLNIWHSEGYLIKHTHGKGVRYTLNKRRVEV